MGMGQVLSSIYEHSMLGTYFGPTSIYPLARSGLFFLQLNMNRPLAQNKKQVKQLDPRPEKPVFTLVSEGPLLLSYPLWGCLFIVGQQRKTTHSGGDLLFSVKQRKTTNIGFPGIFEIDPFELFIQKPFPRNGTGTGIYRCHEESQSR